MEEIIGVIFFIGIIWLIVFSIRKKCRQNLRDKAAHQVLDQSFNFENEKAEILSINKQNPYINIENKCPICNNLLLKRYGIYGAFLGCSSYPRCNFTKRIN